MSRRSLLMLGLTLGLPLARTAAGTAPVLQLLVTSDGDNLAFIPDRLTCTAGVSVRLKLRHLGKILDDPHDWVLLKPGTERTFLADADRESDAGIRVLRKDKRLVIAATALCARGHSTAVTFVAPAPGDYPFVCSVPGHGQSMRGILTVLLSTK